MQEIGEAVAATTDPAVVETAALTVQTLLEIIACLHQSIQRFEQTIEETMAVHPEVHIFRSLPGAGAALAPRLVAARFQVRKRTFGTDRGRFASAVEAACVTGIAPVRQRSGKSDWIHFRFACSKFLRQTFHEWAAQSIRYSTWARAYYQQQRDNENGHHAAVRALAFKWIRILFRCWKDRKPYDEKTYLAALRRRGSPLVAALSKA